MKGLSAESVATVGSNINTIGIEGVHSILEDLFENVRVQEEKYRLIDLLPYCQVIAGMAGAKNPKNREAIAALFAEWNVAQDQICIMSDAECALALIEPQGIVLIAGTGSVCLGKNGSKLWQVGGLGKVLGDEGSGYQIGIQALRAAMADEYGWGTPTKLTAELKRIFEVQEVRTLIPKIQRGEISPSLIASCAPLVFQQAHENDAVAATIIDGAAKDLGFLLGTLVKTSDLSHCEVDLWGGLFLSPFADEFIQRVMHSAANISGDTDHLEIINRSRQNVAVQFAIKRRLFPCTIR
jgi:N-acetylglucosamine kinase-like BadF-type ATPase